LGPTRKGGQVTWERLEGSQLNLSVRCGRVFTHVGLTAVVTGSQVGIGQSGEWASRGWSVRERMDRGMTGGFRDAQCVLAGLCGSSGRVFTHVGRTQVATTGRVLGRFLGEIGGTFRGRRRERAADERG